MRAAAIFVSSAFLIFGSLRTQAVEEGKYSFLNATYDRIWVDIDTTRGNEWRDMPLDPSQSAGFDGELLHVKVRLPSREVRHFSKKQIRSVRVRSRLKSGDWLIDTSGIRFVSPRERQEIFQRLRKPLT
ncbi:MAG: hypothetical protein DME35_05480 [Verrucomicrobia bacterium]|nr:MAG: hypothetical protein DME35_05480 [Verrucomicrobiota bacterium]PYL28174.1 MAG: hypothetical protein DMF45_10035 [Verrucomicrobiota bacterium]